MKKPSLLIFILVALAQLGVPAMLAWGRIQTLTHGRVWKFRTAPVDPEDAIRGRYVALRFAAESFSAPEKPESEQIPAGATVYVVLKEDADGFAQVDHVSPTELKGDNVVKARNGYSSDNRQNVWFHSTPIGSLKKALRLRRRLTARTAGAAKRTLLLLCAFATATPRWSNFTSTINRWPIICARRLRKSSRPYWLGGASAPSALRTAKVLLPLRSR